MDETAAAAETDDVNRIRLILFILCVGITSLSGDRPFAAETPAQAALRIWQGMETAVLRVERPDGSTQPLNVRVADDLAERRQGMQYLPATTIQAHPIWFVFPEPTTSGWHMTNVAAALDIVWADSRGYVVKVERMEPAQTGYVSAPQARFALEMAAGEARRLRIQPGTRLSLMAQPSGDIRPDGR